MAGVLSEAVHRWLKKSEVRAHAHAPMVCDVCVSICVMRISLHLQHIHILTQPIHACHW